MILCNEAPLTQWCSATFYISKNKLFIAFSHVNLTQQLSVNFLNNILGCKISSMGSSFTVMFTAVLYKHCRLTSPDSKLLCANVQHRSIHRYSFQPLYCYVTSGKDFSLDSYRSDFHWASCTSCENTLLKLRLWWGFCFLHFHSWLRYSSRVIWEIWKLIGSLMWKPLIFPVCLMAKVCSKFFSISEKNCFILSYFGEYSVDLYVYSLILLMLFM